jgi:hypothetical protein
MERTSRAKYLRKHDRDDVARRMPVNLLERARANATAEIDEGYEGGEPIGGSDMRGRPTPPLLGSASWVV